MSTLPAPIEWRIPRVLPIALPAAAVLVYVAALFAPNVDAGVFSTIGWEIVHGETPYLDVWDHKPPLIFLIHALSHLVGGWPALVVLSIGAVVAIGWMLMPLTNVPTAMLVAAMLATWPASQGGGLAETFSTLFAVGSVILALRERWVWAGALAATALMTSLQLVAFLPAILILAGSRWSRATAGGVLAALPVVIWLGLAGALAAAWDAVVTYSSVYVGLDRSADLTRYGADLLFMSLPPIVLAVLGGRPRSRLQWAMVAWIVAGLAVIASNGRIFPQYFAPLLVPLALLAAPAVARWRRTLAVPVAMAVVIGWGAVLSPLVMHSMAGTQRSLATWMAQHTDPGDSVLVWGHLPAVYEMADREVAGRYPYLLPLTTPGYATAGIVNAWIASLEAAPPTVIVDGEAYQGRGPFAVPPPGSAGGRTLDIVQPFRVWVADHYDLSAEIGGRDIYVRRPPP